MIMRQVLQEVWRLKSTIVMISTPLCLAIMLPFYEELGLTQKACNCLFMLLLMAVYWCADVIPLAVTSLIPLVLSPLLSIQKANNVSMTYFRDLNIMYMGSLIMAAVVESSQLHKRIALVILKNVGTNPRLLMLGFMIPSWFLSMWISNTATTAMMLAIVQAVITQLQSDDLNDLELQQVGAVADGTSSDQSTSELEKSKELDVQVDVIDSRPCKKNRWLKTSKAFSLCVCYAATSGGIATLTGTTPNLILMENVVRVSEEQGGYPFGLDFATWMGLSAPVSFLMMMSSWLWLQFLFVGIRGKAVTDGERLMIKSVINREYDRLGPVQWKELVALGHFLTLALLWISRNPGGLGGWTTLFDKGYVTDSTAAILVCVSCFMWPRERPDLFWWRKLGKLDDNGERAPPQPLVTWRCVESKVPWGLILLLGGGLALADSISVSGLSKFIGEGLNVFAGWPNWATIMCLSVITACLTEVTSNTAISTIFLPIVAEIALANQMNPLYLMLPVCISASFAFMLPVATPPNALAFGTGVLEISDMMKSGFALNLVGVCFSTLATVTWGEAIFSLSSFTPLQSNSTAILSSAEANITALADSVSL